VEQRALQQQRRAVGVEQPVQPSVVRLPPLPRPFEWQRARALWAAL